MPIHPNSKNSVTLLPLLLMTTSCVSQAAPVASSKPVDKTTVASRRPAQIYFGAYRNMDQLVKPGAEWDFVKQNMDGFVMHFGFWLNNDFKGDPIGVGKKLSAQLNPLGKKWMMEVGWPGNGMEDHFHDMGQWYGERHARQIQQFHRDTNIKTDEISCDFRLWGMLRVAEHYPDFDAQDVYQQVTGDSPNYPADGKAKAPYWPDYMKVMNRELPDTKVHVTFPPLYVPWEEFSGAGKNFNFTVPRVTAGKSDNATMKYKGRDFIESLFKENVSGFIADSPYNIATKYSKQGYMPKVLAMQNWLHGRGEEFSYIVNTKPDAKLAPDDWDASYKADSLKSIQLFQSMGGRADRYIFESWHIGPYRIVPETQEGTFTNLIKVAIKYLKGTDQKLDLKVKTSEAAAPVGTEIYQLEPSNQQVIKSAVPTTTPLTYEIILENKGEIACMPAVSAFGDDDTGNLVRYSVGGRDVTESIRSAEGYVFTNMLQVGESATLTVTLLPDAKGQKNLRRTTLRAFWNPQDAGTVRDSISISTE